MVVLDTLAHVATGVFGAGGGAAVAIALIRRGEKRDANTARTTAAEAREETARHKIADGAKAREESVLARLHDDCRREVAEANEKIGALFESHATAQVELTRVVGQLARCEEQHEEQRRVNVELRRESAEQRRESAILAERLSRLERRSDPPAMEPAE